MHRRSLRSITFLYFFLEKYCKNTSDKKYHILGKYFAKKDNIQSIELWRIFTIWLVLINKIDLKNPFCLQYLLTWRVDIEQRGCNAWGAEQLIGVRLPHIHIRHRHLEDRSR